MELQLKIEEKNKRHRDLERKHNETIMPIIQDNVLFVINDQVTKFIWKTCLDSLLAFVAAVLRLSIPRETKLSASMEFEISTCKAAKNLLHATKIISIDMQCKSDGMCHCKTPSIRSEIKLSYSKTCKSLT